MKNQSIETDPNMTEIKVSEKGCKTAIMNMLTVSELKNMNTMWWGRKDIRNFQEEILKMKNTVSEVKTSVGGITSRLDLLH